MSTRLRMKAGAVLPELSSGSEFGVGNVAVEGKLLHAEVWFVFPGLVIPTEGEHTCTAPFTVGAETAPVKS